MPYKRMSAHCYPVCLGKFKIGSCGFKIECGTEIVLCGIGFVLILVQIVHGLHIIFAGKRAELRKKKLHMSRCMEIPPVYCCSYLKIRFIGCLKIHDPSCMGGIVINREFPYIIIRFPPLFN